LPSLSPRQRQVLQATVRHYVDTTEPVGSKTLVRRFGLEASPATVRSAMGALEQRGLLTQPHTSAGRIPSQAGYRTYVDQLLPGPGAAALQLERELMGLSLRWAALDDLLLQLARRLADLTGLLSLITPPQRQLRHLQALRLVPSGERMLVFLVDDGAATSSLNLPCRPKQPSSCPPWSTGSAVSLPAAGSTGPPCRVSCAAVRPCCNRAWPATARPTSMKAITP
jgi:heat-inducible transcriptional repressor